MRGNQAQTALLRVLVSVAWADGEVSAEEAEYIRNLCRRFELSAGEAEAILSLTRTPIGWEGFQEHLRGLDSLRREPASRQELIRSIEGLIDLDQRRTPEEERYLAFLRAWAGEEPSEACSPEPWKGLWRSARSRIGSLSDRLSPRSLAAVLEQAARSKMPPREDLSTPQRRHYAILFGALISRVIQADRVARPEEVDRLRRILEEEHGFSAEEGARILEVIERQLAAENDRQRLCAEFNRITEMEDRLGLLKALFSVALADGRLSPEEEEEIRLIANYLWIETQEFVRLRLDALGRPPEGGLAS
jgi:uncharacterized tellurite resistance protein B-like protein